MESATLHTNNSGRNPSLGKLPIYIRVNYLEKNPINFGFVP
jgi:hypothetical protein